MDISNGLGVGVALFTQGCPIHCPGCFQPETWSLNGGEEYTAETEEKILELIDRPYISRFSILGGEPLIERNLFLLSTLISKIKAIRPDIKIWLYSGYTIEQLQDRLKNNITGYLQYILNSIDILVIGPFIQEQKDITLQFKGSANQRLLDMWETDLTNNVIVDYELN